MGKHASIPAEFRRERAKAVQSVTLDQLLMKTMASQFSHTNIIVGLIELAMDEYVFLREKEMVAASGSMEPLVFPMNAQDKDFVKTYAATREKLELEFRERFCSNPPYGSIEWGKLFEFLQSKDRA